MSGAGSPDYASVVVNALKGKGFQFLDLETAISDIVILTTTQGASTLTLTLVDEDWEILTSGWLDTDSSGYLKSLDITFPEGTDMNWRLCAVEASTDLSQPNVTLTFEDRIVSLLRTYFGAKKATRGPSMTRAEFIRSLCKPISVIKFRCPELRVVQPVQPDPDQVGSAAAAVANSVATSVAGAILDSKANQAETNPGKRKGFHSDSGITVKGAKANAVQLKAIEEALAEADRLNAPELAVVVMVCAGTGESGFTPSLVDFATGSHKGVFQSNVVPQFDTTQQAHYFLMGGHSFQGGGAIAQVRRGATNVDQIAKAVEGSDSPPNFYGKWESEARKTIAAYGGAGFDLSAPSSTPTDITTSTYAFTRGTTEDPDEDSWACMNRLAQEVNWSLFASGSNLYYMDGPDLIGQKPSLILDRTADRDKIALLSFSWDNTAFEKGPTTKAGKKKRPANLERADTPTEGKLDLVCGIDDYRAGEVFVLRNCGPADGRWIVTDATRSVFNTFTEFTLSPPTSPVPEPAPVVTTTSTPDAGTVGDLIGQAVTTGETAATGGGSNADLVAFLKTGPSPKEIIDRFFIPTGAKLGATCPAGALTPANVVIANRNHSTNTSSGNLSDHKGPPSRAWAADQDIGGDIRYGNHAGALRGDRIAKAECALLGTTWQGPGLQNIFSHGYKFQIIWRTDNPVGHFNHVHCGCHKL